MSFNLLLPLAAVAFAIVGCFIYVHGCHVIDSTEVLISSFSFYMLMVTIISFIKNRKVLCRSLTRMRIHKPKRPHS